jgi:D-beta-D-heptose 7-phosphate kinase/D-beta-D-heptose 1-phosphate adenosyltransferase
MPETDRARVLAALEVVDAVVPFEEDTPEALIRRLLPDVLVKGADYAEDQIVGKETVESRGGRVVRVPLVEGRSTSAIVEEILRRHG